MRFACLTCALFCLFFAVSAQPPDFELIRKDLEKVDSLIFTLSISEVFPILKEIRHRKIDVELSLLVDVYQARGEILNKEEEKGNSLLNITEESVYDSNDAFLIGNWLLSRAMYFFRTKDNESSREVLQQSVSYLRQYRYKKNTSLATALKYLVMLNHWRLGDEISALKTSQDLADVLSEFPYEGIYHADSYYSMGSIFNHKGDIEKARVNILKSVVLARRLGWWQLVNNGYVVLGNIFFSARKYNEAIPYYISAIESEKRLNGQQSYALINYYSNCGYMYTMIGNYTSASEFLHMGRHLAKSLEGENSVELSLIEYNLAFNYLREGSIDSAKYHYRENLRIKRKVYGESHEEVGWAFSGLARMYWEIEEYDSSLLYIQKAIIANTKGFDDLSVNSNTARQSISSSLFHLLATKEAVLTSKLELTNDPIVFQQAAALFQKLDTVIFRSISSYTSDVSKLYAIEDMRNVLNLGLRIYSRVIKSDPGNLDAIQKIYYILQKSKAILLLDELAKAEKADIHSVPVVYRKEEQLLRSGLARLEVIDDEATGADSLLTLKLKMLHQLDSLREVVADNYPGYYNLRTSRDFTSFSKLTRKLESGDVAFVEYYWGEKYVYSLTYSNRSFRVRQVEVAKVKLHLDIILKILIERLDAPNLYRVHAEALTLTLFDSEFLTQLGEKPQLHIIPDGMLSRLPFEALIVPGMDGGNDFHNFNYLIKTAKISYNFSSIFLENGRKYIPLDEADVLGLGAYSETVVNLLSLPGSKKELDGISLIKNGEFYPNARKKNLLDNLDEFRILHLAVHGQMDTVTFYGSYLSFLSDESGGDRLYSFELYDKTVPVDLVVLSACESGIGKDVGGEGAMSMGRAFKYSGANMVIQSLWKTDDNAASDVMIRLYKGINEGQPAGLALQFAKIDLISGGDQKTAHPGRWAAFSYYGLPYDPPGYSVCALTFFFFGPIVIAFIWLLYHKRVRN